MNIMMNKVRKWMRQNQFNHQDKKTSEINYTTLAEEAAQVFDLYENDADATIPEWVFDLAVDVVDNMR